MAAFIKRDMVDLQPGETMLYEFVSDRDGPALKRMQAELADDRISELIHEGLLVEVFRYRNTFGVRFVTRPLPSGGELCLIYWDPAPEGSLVWSGTPWCDLQQVDWIDAQWWNAIQSGEAIRYWQPKERAWQFRH
jgi:hypothetical protein